ncbi:hypothetical protein CVM73_19530 [Bradyrhizobium forestalis]|uniref:Uncharacterized protein n=1 Tax=Bradyrhizobium forestalis TaxID=1419263 RepID=A0A2M8R757_9BRAD|nr:hypothetical protein CVM73_19530 [Bradyrhizobium forestalis]
MHIFERHITSLRSQALAANQAHAVDPSLSPSDRQVATSKAAEAQAMGDILDYVKPNLGSKEAQKITARIRALLGAPRECQPVRVGCL